MDGYIFTIKQYYNNGVIEFDTMPIITSTLEEAEDIVFRTYNKNKGIWDSIEFKTTVNMQKFFDTGFC